VKIARHVDISDSKDLGVRDGTIHIAPQARDNILRLAPQSEDGLETGGILLGRGPANDGVVHVEIAGNAGPAADRRSDFFLRDLDHARTLADGAWQKSRAVWVGEWHTHPQGGREPSTSDLSTYVRLLAASELNFEVFVSIIVVPNHGSWGHPELWPWLLELRHSQAREPPSAP
jgi:integrative and conjugative element protein (TIGR02256 family)